MFVYVYICFSGETYKVPARIRAGSKPMQMVDAAKRPLAIHRNCALPLPSVQTKRYGRNKELIPHKLSGDKCISCAEIAMKERRDTIKKARDKRKFSGTQLQQTKKSKVQRTGCEG